MNFLDQKIEEYSLLHTEAEPAILQELNRETHQKVLHPRMLSGHMQGRLLSLITHLIRPKRILEIGTYTGYSAICMAEGLPPGGKIDTIDINDELEPMVRRYVEKAGMREKIHLHYGNALDLIPEIAGNFDLVFIDADKENYLNYFHLIIDRVNPNGLILVDNVLWSGKVLDPSDAEKNKDTRGIIEFNKYVHQFTGVQHVLLPIRDGLMVLRKVG